MSGILKIAQEAINNEEVQEAARTLAKYNLGIFVPHMHDEQTGEILPLPAAVISCERDLKITFLRTADIDTGMEPVAWRWNGSDIEVCASCCSPSSPA